MYYCILVVKRYMAKYEVADLEEIEGLSPTGQ
jgi:hypothetical protein